MYVCTADAAEGKGFFRLVDDDYYDQADHDYEDKEEHVVATIPEVDSSTSSLNTGHHQKEEAEADNNYRPANNSGMLQTGEESPFVIEDESGLSEEESVTMTAAATTTDTTTTPIITFSETGEQQPQQPQQQ